jgi:uncharacterized membrane protein
MATFNPLGSNQNITIENNKVITITQRTVRFSHNVYQTHNITSFTEGELDIVGIPWVIIVVCFIVGERIGSMNIDQIKTVGIVLFFAAMLGIAWNILKPKYIE